MPRSKERNFPFSFDVEQLDLEAARAAFFSPENNQAELDSLFEHLWEMADGKSENFTSNNPRVSEALRYIFTRLNEAQRFNENYLGHMLSEPSIAGLYAYMMALRINSNTVAREVSSVESELEPEAIRWMSDLIGYDPEKSSGTFTSGGSSANLTALWVAREKAARKDKEAVERGEAAEFEGKYVLLVNPFVHYSIDKAAHILGGPRADIEVMKVGSENLAIDPVQLEEQIQEILDHNSLMETEIERLTMNGVDAEEVLRLKKQMRHIVGIVSIAGETEAGVVDPIAEIGEVARKYQIFHHVDAAYGLPYLLSSRGYLFEGISEADSVTFDPHKALYTPYSAGAVMFKDKKDHSLIHFKNAAYVFKGDESLGQKRAEGSMGAGAILATLAAIKSMSGDEYKALFDHTLNNIEFLYDRILESNVLAPVHTPDLNVLCFTIRPEVAASLGIEKASVLTKYIDAVRKRLNDDHGFFFSSTDLPVDDSVEPMEAGTNIQPVFRAVLMHPRTQFEQIDQAINQLEALVLNSGDLVPGIIKQLEKKQS